MPPKRLNGAQNPSAKMTNRIHQRNRNSDLDNFMRLKRPPPNGPESKLWEKDGIRSKKTALQSFIAPNGLYGILSGRAQCGQQGIEVFQACILDHHASSSSFVLNADFQPELTLQPLLSFANVRIERGHIRFMFAI